MENVASLSRHHGGEPIYFQHDRADHWYRIVRGAARECALQVDGRRQVVDFLLPGDVFGFCTQPHHRFSCEVIAEGTLLARYPRRRVESLAESNPEVAHRVQQLAFDSIERLQMRAALLGFSTAHEKVGAFLLQMAQRCGAGRQEPIVLPMSRYDIADYLALAVETVSRTFTLLQRRHAIEVVAARQIRITNRSLLDQQNGNGQRGSGESTWPCTSSSDHDGHQFASN